MIERTMASERSLQRSRAHDPDAVALDGFVDNVKAFDNMTFGTVQLSKVRLRPSPTGYTVAFHAHTADPTPPPTDPLASLSTGVLEPGQQYLAVLKGLAASQTDPLALKLIDDELSLTASTVGKARAVHAAVGVAEIDVGRIDTSSVWQDIADFNALEI